MKPNACCVCGRPAKTPAIYYKPGDVGVYLCECKHCEECYESHGEAPRHDGPREAA